MRGYQYFIRRLRAEGIRCDKAVPQSDNKNFLQLYMHIVTHMLQVFLYRVDHIFPYDMIPQIMAFYGNIVALAFS